MKIDLLEKFKSSLKSMYVFHLHTVYTDGLNSIEDYCRWALDNKFNTLFFTEHVRRRLSYNFDNFLKDIEIAKNRFPNIDIWIGAEAKILPSGELDMPNDILPKIQLICFACHSFPADIDEYQESFERLFVDKRWKDYIRIWVHPGRFLKQQGLLEKYLKVFEKLIGIAINESIFIENNLRDGVLPYNIFTKIPPSVLITGYDAHSVEAISELGKVFKNEC